MKTCIISFSSRANGNCAQIAHLVESMTQDAVLFDFSGFNIHPCGKCACECFADREKCPYIGDMECGILEAVTNSDITYFILPNYCDYPCANYFIFNERSQCWFRNRPDLLDRYLKVPKRCIVVSNTNRDNFTQALAYQSEIPPEILFLSAKKYGKISIQGNLLESNEAVEEIRRFVKKQPANRSFRHKSLEERAAEYGGINLEGELDWLGAPVGNELNWNSNQPEDK